MNFKFNCIHCGQRISADSENAGTEANCPTCNQRISVPQIPSVPSMPCATASASQPPAPEQRSALPSKKKSAWPDVVAVLLLFVAMEILAFFPHDKMETMGPAGGPGVVPLMILFVAAVVTWIIFGIANQRRFAFLGFAGVCVALSLYLAHHGDRPALNKMRANTMEAIDQAQQGKKFVIKETGSATIDPTIAELNDFFGQCYADKERMEAEIKALQEENILSTKVWGEKSRITLEISKRRQSISIIDRHQLAVEKMVASMRVKMPDAESLERASKSFREMFELKKRLEGAESDFLNFLSRAFNDYTIENGKIAFKAPSGHNEFDRYTRAIGEVMREGEEFQERQLRAMEAAKTKLQNLKP